MNQPTKDQLKDQLALAADALIKERERAEANNLRLAGLVLDGWRPMETDPRMWHRPDNRLPWWWYAVGVVVVAELAAWLL